MAAIVTHVFVSGIADDPAAAAAGEVLPRFYRFNYLIATSTFSAGAVSAYLSLEPPAGFVSTLYPNNFSSGL